MSTRSNAMALCLWASILIAGALPLALYWPSFYQPIPPEALLIQNVGFFEQWLVVLAAFVVKPVYMLLSLAWIVWLWRRQATDLVALRWGLIWFLGGEIACAINYVVFGGTSAMTDYLHSYAWWWGFRLLPTRCWKEWISAWSNTASEGSVRRLESLQFVHQVCGRPLRAAPLVRVPHRRPHGSVLDAALRGAEAFSHRTNILNSVQQYSNPMWSQLFEGRYCAIISILAAADFLGGAVLQARGARRHSQDFLCRRYGPLGFGLLRLFLRTAYGQDLVWANIWEELTELIFIAGVGIVLWLFRGALFREEPALVRTIGCRKGVCVSHRRLAADTNAGSR